MIAIIFVFSLHNILPINDNILSFKGYRQSNRFMTHFTERRKVSSSFTY